MNGWIKHYADGTSYIGDDTLVYSGGASWRKSALQGIVEVHLSHDQFIGKIRGPGEYWQSDSFQSVFPGGSNMTTRRIQRKIAPGDAFFKVATSSNLIEIVFNDRGFRGVAVVVDKSWIDRWVTILYDVNTKAFNYRIMEQM